MLGRLLGWREGRLEEVGLGKLQAALHVSLQRRLAHLDGGLVELDHVLADDVPVVLGAEAWKRWRKSKLIE